MELLLSITRAVLLLLALAFGSCVLHRDPDVDQVWAWAIFTTLFVISMGWL